MSSPRARVTRADNKFFADLDQLFKRVAALERTQPVCTVYMGPRDDPAGDDVYDGVGPRVRIGLLSDGTYGVERWSQAGARTVY